MRELHAIAMDERVHRIQAADEDGMAFLVRSPLEPGRWLRVICSNGLGWDHVSVSLEHRCPVHEELEEVRDICFLETECVMQLSVPYADHIDHHPHCLHMWRPRRAEIPRPPGWMVGPERLAGKKQRG